MALYQDGTEVKVGDVFSSTRSDPLWSWEIVFVSETEVVWKSIDFSYTGNSHISDTKYWLLLKRANGKRPERRLSGFSKFIRRIEG